MRSSARSGLAVALLIAVALLSHWILGKALLPVSRMTDDAADWSDNDLDRRFNRGEPYDELTQLAATLDALLERLSASLRHEQRFTAEMSHELRTPLAKIAAETELALRRERTGDDYRGSLEAVHRNAEQMTRTVEALVSAARQEAGLSRTSSDARDGIAAAVAAVQEDAVAAGIEVELSLPSSPVRVAIDVDLLERIVHPLLDNALRYGEAQVSVELRTNGTMAVLDVGDDGTGLRDTEVDVVFEPGVRGAAAVDGPAWRRPRARARAPAGPHRGRGDRRSVERQRWSIHRSPPARMITSWLLGLPPLLVYGALFALIAGESAGLPLPGETSLIAVGVLASQHGRSSRSGWSSRWLLWPRSSATTSASSSGGTPAGGC